MIRMCIEIFAMHNVHVFLQDHESYVQLLPSPLYVDLLMDLVCVSEADSTFKAYYAGFMRWKKLLRMVDIFPGNPFHVAFIYLL